LSCRDNRPIRTPDSGAAAGHGAAYRSSDLSDALDAYPRKGVDAMTPAFHDNEGAPAVGFFTYSVLDDRWSWSDGMYLLHGYEAGEVLPSTELLLEHEHPDDGAGMREVLDTAVRTGSLFGCYHRVVDRQRHCHAVLAVGRGIPDEHGFVARVEGFYVDIAELPHPAEVLSSPRDRSSGTEDPASRAPTHSR
jgi:hypothetical protein